MSRKRRIATYWWNEQANFGDAMNPLLLERLFGVEIFWAPLKLAQLTAAGSLIQWITPAAAERRDLLHVWGSGFIFGEEPAPPRESVKYHAVRGHKSAKMAGLSEPYVCGDPGLLASQVVPRPLRLRRGRVVGIVPHLLHHKALLVRDAVAKYDLTLIDVTGEPESVISRIAGCDFILSSSLHGLIIADSYGIPNRWFSLEPHPFGRSWKFDDYYSVYGLQLQPVSLEDLALDTLIKETEENYTRDGIDLQKQALFEAFPFT